MVALEGASPDQMREDLHSAHGLLLVGLKHERQLSEAGRPELAVRKAKINPSRGVEGWPVVGHPLHRVAYS